MAKDLPLARGSASRRDRPRHSLGRGLLLLIVLATVTLILLAFLRVGAKPLLSLEPALPGLGPATPVTLTASEPGRGLSEVRLEVIQGERVYEVARESFEARPFWAFWGPRTTDRQLTVDVGSRTLEGLTAGEATLRAVAERAGTWVRSPAPVVVETSLPVRLTPPSVEILARGRVAQGGSGVVVYRVGPAGLAEGASNGVQAGDWWFPGAALPAVAEGTEGERFALFGAPYDLEDASSLRLVVRDALGNEAARSFVTDFERQPMARDDIEISDAFMGRVVPAILGATPQFPATGDPLADYLAINGKLRAANAETLVELGRSSEPALLWSGRFLQLPRSQVMSSFADRRTYKYQGRDVDTQDHLGYDLASVAQALVPAANSGVVVLAEYFGIYGNTVVVDHGYGLQSLYAHLSILGVEKGDRVDKGQILGRTGSTGLSGGDHLHFTILLRGLAVDPVEWWDGGWIRTRLEDALGPAQGPAS